MKTIFEPASRKELIQRAQKLSPDSQRVFGTMNPDQGLHHVNSAFRMYLGEIPSSYDTNPILSAIGRLVTFSPIPIPRGKAQTSPSLLATERYDLEIEKKSFTELIEKVAQQQSQSDWPVHPFFGKLSSKQYGELGYKHTDHHLKQFGV